MLDIALLEHSGFFQNIPLKPSEVLFGEGDTDNKIYIIKSGEITVEKKLKGTQNHSKVLAVLGEGKIFGEGALNNSDPKQVSIKAKEETHLLAIDAGEGIESFLSQKPVEGLKFLKHIIDLGNKRVLKVNEQITSTYDIGNAILKLEKIDYKSIFELIDRFKSIIQADYIFFLEKNNVLDGYYNLKYDTRKSGKMLDTVIEIFDEKSIGNTLKNAGIQIGQKNIVEKLHIGDYNIGYFIIGKQSDFDENEKKIIISISSSLAGVMRQKKLIDEERDKSFLSH